MERIKYILWDIDRTLLDFEYSEKEGLNLTFEQFGYDRLDEKMLSKYKIINDKYWEKLENGEISKQEVLEGRFNEFFDLYGYDKSIVPKFNEEYQKNMGTVVEFLPNAKEIVTKLKESYKQYAATNGTAVAQKKKMSTSGLDKLLDGFFISEEMGVVKPFEEYFEKIFDAIGSHNLDEYLMIGDSLTSDISGGVKVGIKTCWYNPNHKENNMEIIPDYEIDDLYQVIRILKQ